MANVWQAKRMLTPFACTTFSAISRRRDDVTTFCQSLLHDLGLESLFGIHHSEGTILIFKLFEQGHERCSM